MAAAALTAMLLIAHGGASGDPAAGERLAIERCVSCHSNAGAARLAGQNARYTAWSLQPMRGGTRSQGTSAKPDPLLARLSNDEIESLSAHFAALQ